MRLTEKIEKNIYSGNPFKSHLIVNKLGQLEDLMEKYDIETLEQVESSFIGFVTDYTEEGRNHIGELLKLEDELGIDLVTLFKALKDGIYIKKAKNYDKEKYPYNAGREDLIFFDKEFIYLNCINELAYEKDFYKGFVYLKDYGKTWALTEEELL